MKKILTVLIVFLMLSCKATNVIEGPEKVLVFTKTSGYHHKSIEAGVKAIEELGLKNNFEVTQTEDSELFSKKKLKQYQLVIFLNTTGDVLNTSQEQAFEAYIKSGGSFMGVHAATDTEFEWPWFGKLVGAYFLDHPKQATATITRLNSTHLSTKHLQEQWIHFDEWYNFKSINQDINVLLNLDESTYEGGKNGINHPIAWYHEFDGGRSFYTGLGHTSESYEVPEFKQHLLGGILYCLKR
ncbi:ThuA domain-containing protein [Mariniflexile litorale]|uniref:ThuA domain-containing protein n=1 Tax=Mariniflexile litorale TaxID=3045158 RepID=A0AAU7EJG3_9FLAO|nr:ThuA domain-containing protein [Mariniflexile sp. KMM 9835]MDQ8211417.1 ThuA domain-containing protein [Mariniflexile sp. KMM 9835]